MADYVGQRGVTDNLTVFIKAARLRGESLDVLVTFGAGDIDRLVEPITEMLQAE